MFFILYLSSRRFVSERHPKPSYLKRNREDEFVRLFGFHAVIAALENPKRKHRKLLGTLNALNKVRENIPDIEAMGLVIEEVSTKDLSRQLNPDTVHNGIMLICEPLEEPRLKDIEIYGPIILLDQVTDPHNVGAILRSAAAFQVSAVITTFRHSPAPDGVLAKSASGGLEHVPYLRVRNLSEAIKNLQDRGIACLGLDGEAERDISSPGCYGPYALVMGAEGKGLRAKTRDYCDQLVKLPLPGDFKVLNVSNAAAIGLYALHQLG